MKKTILTFLGFLLLLGFILSLYLLVKEDNKRLTSEGDLLYTYFYKTQNDADCILIKQGNANILIDTGEKTDAEGIVKFLNEKNVDTLHFLILTHSDKDHIGGASAVIQNFKVEKVIKPYYSKANKDMDAIDIELKKLKIPVMYQLHTGKFSLGGINLFVYPPLEKRYSDDNNYSIVTLVTHKNVKMLFAGDAGYKRTNELLEINWSDDIDLLKIPYHGRQLENSKLFIKTISPDFAVITSDDADESIKEVCEAIGAEVFYTLNDKVQFVSDGEILKVLEE